MKKALFLLSLAMMTVWIAGVFIFHAPPAIHIILVLSILAYIRSLMAVSDSPRNNFSYKQWFGK